MKDILAKLDHFRKETPIRTKGPLCVVLHITRIARDEGLPLDPSNMLAPKRGQVKGLGKARVQSILKEYGITRVLAEEAGRTSRGSIDIMRSYVAFLNNLGELDNNQLERLESWWVDQVKLFFASKPFKLKYDNSKSFKSIISELLSQAVIRQKESPGTMVVGAMLQHLVGAKIECVLGPGQIEHNGASVADAPTGRPGDFIIDDVAIHVTSAPGEALIRKCAGNINSNFKPLIVTISSKITVAEELAKQADLENRIDVFEIEQFMAANVYELSKFSSAERAVTIKSIIDKYNDIVETCESDPGLKINFGR